MLVINGKSVVSKGNNGLHLDTNESKGAVFFIVVLHFSHSSYRVFNNEHNSCTKMSAKHFLACN
jgi:hypothetical protein